MKKYKKIIVSSADAKYFFLLKELLLSIQDHNLSDDFDIGILDTGLNLDQTEYLSKLGVLIKKAKWNVEFPNYKIRGRNYLKNLIARAFLPEYFLAKYFIP